MSHDHPVSNDFLHRNTCCIDFAANSFNCKKKRILQSCTDTKPHGSSKISVNSAEFVTFFFLLYNLMPLMHT